MTTNHRFKLTFIIVCCFISFGMAQGQIILQDSLMDGSNYEKAAFDLWFKNDVKTIQGIFILMPGSNGDGRNAVKDIEWQKLALKYNFALMGCYYVDKSHDNMSIENYVDVKNGSGQALLDILQKFSRRSGHSELTTAPLAFWGASAGGEFNYEFVCWKPERVLAFIVNKGGVYYSSLAPAASWEVPGVFIAGEKDSPYRNNIVIGIFSINRRFGAKWIFAEEPGAAHEFPNSEKFAHSFFDQIIPLRLSNDPTHLKSLDQEGFIGTVQTHQILKASEYKGEEVTSWFVNRELAQKWLEFIK